MLLRLLSGLDAVNIVGTTWNLLVRLRDLLYLAHLMIARAFSMAEIMGRSWPGMREGDIREGQGQGVQIVPGFDPR
jgi:hypothetical protein